MDIPLYLSGNFAELRSNHFHTGIDIKTQGVEGQKILAVEDGIVSRIKVSPWGYGKALYIDHPSGYTTVYGHLSSFSEKIDRVVKSKQYAEESFSVDFAPEESISVAAGEVIALSGNSGSSGGPHLHFEIRRTSDSRPLNPLKFGFEIKDDIPPRIRGVRFHPLSDTTLINGTNEAISFVIHGSDGKYRLKAGTNIEVYGAFGISVHTLDYLNGYPNKCGVYSIDLKVDGEPVCSQRFDELDFATVRHINSYKAYDVYHTNRWHYHKSFIDPGNELDIYGADTRDSGKLFFPEKGEHKATYTIADAYGNTSYLNFEFTSLALPDAELPVPETYDAFFSFDADNRFSYGDELGIEIPEGGLYADLKFRFGREMPGKDHYSPRYSLHNGSVPLQKNMKIMIKADAIPADLRPKVLAVRYSDTGAASYITGSFKKERFSLESNRFGKFALVVDTIPPEIRMISGKPAKLSESDLISFSIKDDRSGISDYDAYLDGRWVLTEYDPKKNSLRVNLEGIEAVSENPVIELVIRDGVGNETVEVVKF